MNPHVFSGVLNAAQQAEDWAWAQLYEWLAPQLGGYFRARGLTDPEDMVGAVFVQMARNLSSFDGNIDGFRSWVFMIAHNRLMNERRRRGRRPIALSSDIGLLDDRVSASAEDQAMARLGEDRAGELLEMLTDSQREVVALRVVAGFSVEEAATITGRSVSSVKQLQRRGLEVLRRHLQERV
jgi:RNA polymerase sigma-70 factor (ECF subfamily)